MEEIAETVEITIFYRIYNDCEGRPTQYERYITTFIIDSCYLLEFLPFLVREDIERVEVCKYDR